LTRQDQWDESRQLQQRQQALVDAEKPHVNQMKRTRTHKENMNQEDASPSPTSSVTLPNAATLLRISAAPNSISEKNVMVMVREMTGSRVFPRSKLVTALDFIRLFCSSTTRVSDVDADVETSGLFVSLGHMDAEEAYRVADASLRDVTFSGCRPSILACAAITLALLRSNDVNHNMSSLRRSVYCSVFRNAHDTVIYQAIRKVELRLLRTTQSAVTSASRNVSHVLSTSTTHVIPLEDE
jgi:hypothetical protein